MDHISICKVDINRLGYVIKNSKVKPHDNIDLYIFQIINYLFIICNECDLIKKIPFYRFDKSSIESVLEVFNKEYLSNITWEEVLDFMSNHFNEKMLGVSFTRPDSQFIEFC
jgi:hypothetical protein